MQKTRPKFKLVMSISFSTLITAILYAQTITTVVNLISNKCFNFVALYLTKLNKYESYVQSH